MPADSPAAVAEALAAAINVGDRDTALALWSADSVFVPADGPSLKGIEAISELVDALIESASKIRIELTQTYVAGATAVCVGTLTMGRENPPEEAFEVTTHRAIVVYSRGNDGAWRIAIDAPWGFPER